MNVFISHASEDEDLARRVGEFMRKEGFEVWDSSVDVLPGENWGDKLGKALRDADAMVVLLTPRSVHSRTVNYEISYALGNEGFRNRLIPVIADGLSPESVPWVLRPFESIVLPQEEWGDNLVAPIAQALTAQAVR